MAQWARRLRISRRMAVAGALVVAGIAAVTAFGVGAGDDGIGVSRARITIAALPGADVASSPFSVAVDRGALRGIRVTDPAGRPVPGRIARDGRSWRPLAPLARGTRYTAEALAVDADGRTAVARAAFTTLRDHFTGRYNTGQDQTVGTGMIISIEFSRPLTDRAAVQHAITVTARPAVLAAPHWFGARRLDFRPQRYWTPGTRVTLSLRLRGVEGAPGVYGVQDEDVNFVVGREQTTTVDARAHTLTVRHGNQVVRVLPVSAGGGDHPTYDGVMVISEKHPMTRMNGQTVGFGGVYDIQDVPHALRLTDSGTFVHGNYWSDDTVFGNDNTSHGCIGLQDVKGGGDGRTPAAWYFDNALIGDTVEVTNGGGPTVAPDNGLSGWNMPWPQWIAGAS